MHVQMAGMDHRLVRAYFTTQWFPFKMSEEFSSGGTNGSISLTVSLEISNERGDLDASPK